MKFNFEDGQFREYKMGQKFHGLKINCKRPISVTLTRDDFSELSKSGVNIMEYLHYIRSALSLKGEKNV